MPRHRCLRPLTLAAFCTGLAASSVIGSSISSALAQASSPTPLTTAPSAGGQASAPAATGTGRASALPQQDPSAIADAARSIDVIVDGERHSWQPLESGTGEAWDAYRKGAYQQAVPVFARLARLGHPVAEWLMGNVYYAGQGVPQDYRRALDWFEKAAAQGFLPAYAPTAQLYENGQGTAIDLGKAYMWYNIAIAALPNSLDRYNLTKQRDKVAAMMTPAQIEAAQKRSLSFLPKKVVPPDLETARAMLGE